MFILNTHGKKNVSSSMADHIPIIDHINGNLHLRAGSFYAKDAKWSEEPLTQGLKIVLIQQGKVSYQIGQQPERCIEGPSLCVMSHSGDPTLVKQRVDPHTLFCYTRVTISSETLPQCTECMPEVLLQRLPENTPKIVYYPAPKVLLALAVQIATCPMQGTSREMYLGGKALEFAAISIQGLRHDASMIMAATTQSLRLRATDIARIHEAREFLINHLQTPLTLESLAAKVGLSPRKLTAGFRQVFGNSVFGYLHEYRLCEAHRLLCTGEFNVSTVAYHVGFSPAHFSVAFHNRYHVLPSILLAKDR